MIFLSHNSKDKPIVEPIAIKLREIYGQDQVFYDSWSIQPGDGIIDKMNSGLEQCKLFFYFVSNNSLSSYMVKLEWQNAVMKASKGEARLIPVRIDNCNIPPILQQSLYIDMYSNGFDVALRQIVDVANGTNTFRQQYQSPQNILATINLSRSGKKILVKLEARYFMEPIPHFAFSTSNTGDQIDYKIPNCSMYSHGFNKNTVRFKNGSTVISLNAIRIDFPTPLTPPFPLEAEFTAKGNVPIAILSVLHEDEKDKWVAVETKIRTIE